MRILHIITTFEFGGAENHLRILAKEQTKAGHLVTVCFLKGHANYSNIPFKVIDLSKLGFIRKYLKILAVQKKFNPHIVHSHLPLAEILVSLLPSHKSYKKVLTRHVSGKYSQKAMPNIFKPLSRYCLRRHNHVIAISKAVEKSLRSVEKTLASITVVYYGYLFSGDDLNSKASYENKRESEQTNQLVSFARLVPQKRLDVSIRAAAQALESGCNLQYKIYGEGKLHRRLTKLITFLNVTDKVFILPKTEDVSTKMGIADALVVPSAFEGFGMVYLEAIDAKLPIISSRNEAAIEILGEDYPLLFETNDVLELCKIIAKFTTKTPQERKLMCKARYMEIGKKFSAESMMKNTLHVYKNVMEGNPVPRTHE